MLVHTLACQTNHLPRTFALEKKMILEVNTRPEHLFPSIERDIDLHTVKIHLTKNWEEAWISKPTGQTVGVDTKNPKPSTTTTRLAFFDVRIQSQAGES